ncbi:DMT family transporter [Brucella haematophila]|uniref:DMT family transporter n=1 Tax=Brucella haematophila TaxID=419474 RepID=UPI00110E46F0|nr:DMT family transporter [Brucella haematophila]TMV01132.1 DMT family transporter [Brucella haematophila]
MLWTLFGILSGACIAIQAPINAALARGLGSPPTAAAISFLAGAVILAIVSTITAKATGNLPTFNVPAGWLFVAGGALGCIYVTASILLTPRIGAAAVMGLAVAGQLMAGLLADRIGFMGVAVREITAGRVVGAVLLLTGALMIRFL